MADNGQSISRRKVLGSLGVIGGAAALGGASTMAFFSDEENFANNQIVAGELDLKVDWEEHYSDWSDDESGDLAEEVVMTDGDPANVPQGYVGLPDPTQPLIAVSSADLSTFMDNTAVESYPDTDDNGVQDDFADNPGETTGDGVGYICEDGADTPEDLDPNGGTGLRTLKGPNSRRGEATVDANGNPLPLVYIDDVKPGDFGEVTFSFHLCDNPGYVWLQAANVVADENGYTEPERKDPDESGDADGDGEDDTVELLDEIQTTWWYDTDGDNVLDSGDSGGGQQQDICVELVLDASGSMSGSKNQNTIDGAKNLAQSILGANAQNRVGVTFFSASGYSSGAMNQLSVGDSGSQDLTTVESTIESLPANGGSTAVGAGLDTGQNDLQNCPQGSRRVMVLLSNGGENVEPESNVVSRASNYCSQGTEIFTIAVGSGADVNFMEDVACSPDNAFTSPDPSNIEEIFEDVTGEIQADGETVFFRGSLRESLTLLSTDDGFLLDSDPSTDEPDPFEASTTNYIGFAWYLPVDHANEIQTDSVGFDVGFYTEQARHNDPTMGNT